MLQNSEIIFLSNDRSNLLYCFLCFSLTRDLQCSFSLHLPSVEDTEIGREQLLQRILKKLILPPPPPKI